MSATTPPVIPPLSLGEIGSSHGKEEEVSAGEPKAGSLTARTEGEQLTARSTLKERLATIRQITGRYRPQLDSMIMIKTLGGPVDIPTKLLSRLPCSHEFPDPPPNELSHPLFTSQPKKTVKKLVADLLKGSFNTLEPGLKTLFMPPSDPLKMDCASVNVELIPETARVDLVNWLSGGMIKRFDGVTRIFSPKALENGCPTALMPLTEVAQLGINWIRAPLYGMKWNLSSAERKEFPETTKRLFDHSKYNLPSQRNSFYSECRNPDCYSRQWKGWCESADYMAYLHRVHYLWNEVRQQWIFLDDFGQEIHSLDDLWVQVMFWKDREWNHLSSGSLIHHT